MPFVDRLRSVAGGFGTAVGRGLEGAAAMAAVGGTYQAASKVYDHLTKARDFKKMLSSPFNNDLQAYQEAEPEKFNAAFTSLRTVNPALTKDPMVAGAYMRRVMTYDNAGATGVLVEALTQKNTAPVNPILDLAGRGAQMGVQGVYSDRVNKAMDMRQGEVEKLRLLARDEHDPRLLKLRAMEDVKNESSLERDKAFHLFQLANRPPPRPPIPPVAPVAPAATFNKPPRPPKPPRSPNPPPVPTGPLGPSESLDPLVSSESSEIPTPQVPIP